MDFKSITDSGSDSDPDSAQNIIQNWSQKFGGFTIRWHSNSCPIGHVLYIYVKGGGAEQA